MAEQRPTFRFRLPWLVPSEPATTPTPRPVVSTQTVSQPPITPTPAQRPPITTQTPNPTQMPLFRPSGLAPTQSPPPLQAAIRVDSQSTTIKKPDSNTPEPSNVIQTTTQTPLPRPPFRPPGVASSQPNSSQSQMPPRTDSQPSSPSRVGIQSRVSSRTASPSQSQVSSQPVSPSQSRVPPKPASPPLVGTQSQGSSNPPSTSQSRVPPKPASPPLVGTQSQGSSNPPSTSQSRVTPKPASPPLVRTQSQGSSNPPSTSESPVSTKPASPSQSRISSLPASPSRLSRQSQDPSTPPSPSEGTIQSRIASQTSTISHTQPSQTDSARSPSRLAPQPTVKVSPKSSSPAKTFISMQEIEDSVRQPPSSVNLQQVGQATTPPTFIEPQQPLVETLEPKAEESPLKSQDPQPNTQDTSNIMSRAHNQHIQASTTTQPNVLEAKEAPANTQISDSTPGSVDSAFLDDKPKEIKEAEVKRSNGMPEHGETKEKTSAELLTEIANSKPQTEQLSFAIQSEPSEKQLQMKEKLATSVSNGQQSKTNIAHQMDKSSISESRQRPFTSNGAQASLHKEIKDDIFKFVQKMITSPSKPPIDEKSVTIITIAGENRGASMHLGSEVAKRERPIHIRRAYKINPDESGDTTTEGEGSSRGKRLKDPSTKEDKETKAYVNSNNQGVNNSIILDSSISQRNPGVHLAFTRARTDPIKPNNNMDSVETHKSKVGMTPVQKLTYEPVIRRRCLRGLFLEPSDSDDDNPQKPHRHGCRYRGGEKSKDGEIDVL